MTAEPDWPIPGWKESQRLRGFYLHAFGETRIDEIGVRRAWVHDGSDYPRLLRSSLEYLLEYEPFSTKEWRHLTGYQFHTQEELYNFLWQVYTYFFVDADACPQAPDPDRRPPAAFFTGPPIERPAPPDLPPLLDEPLQCSPWYGRFDSDLASAEAFEAVQEAALEKRDLSPILSFAQVWARGAASEGKASAVGTFPLNAPTTAAEAVYEHVALGAEALVYGAFHPVGKVGQAGPTDTWELCNSLFLVRPCTPIDPTSIALAELGLDVPGVDRRFVNFCAGWLNVDTVDEIWELRWNFEAAWPDYRETVRAGLLHLVRNRPLTVQQWYDLTYVRFGNEQELTHYLAQVHAYLYDTYPAMLSAYGMPSSKRT